MRKAAQAIAVGALLVWAGEQSVDPRAQGGLQLRRTPNAQPKNVIFVLVDDLRYDALGYTGHPWIETPHLDALAKTGVQMRNAFVTTALCSPSRASILTGPVRPSASRRRQQQPGAARHHLLSAIPAAGRLRHSVHRQVAHGRRQRCAAARIRSLGQLSRPGHVSPEHERPQRRRQAVPQRGYITDELTDYALDWLKQRRADRPFFLYLSHKAVHSDFVARRPAQGTLHATSPSLRQRRWPIRRRITPGKPMWVRNQRNSWHGVDFPYHSALDIAEYYRRYAETLLAVDESVGRVMALLRERGLLDSTIVMFMGDNGFAFGEHGLIDKRTAYEASMRVPLLMSGGGLPAGTRSRRSSPTSTSRPPFSLRLASNRRRWTAAARCRSRAASGFHGATRCCTRYFWERNFPQTPAMHALRGSRYKYIRYYGVWDTDELYDLQNDPLETRNLIRDPSHRDSVTRLNAELFKTLRETGGMYIPLAPDGGNPQNLRRRDGSRAADFPPDFYPPVK